MFDYILLILYHVTMPHRVSSELASFISSVEWTWAKTYADTWPHHYIVKERVDENLFQKLVLHIRKHGEWELFYNTSLKYFEQDGVVYWTMVPPDDNSKWYVLEKEDIINKCAVDATYKVRKQLGTLPESQ
jgi:hypothetical protein